MPTLSVVCLNKNHLTHLKAAISSILAQENIDLEVIVADGGSDDGSLEYLQSFERVQVLEGVDNSRDEGILRAVDAARGEYIAFMTSTDGYISPTWMRLAVNYLEKDIEAGLVWGGGVKMDRKGQMTSRIYPRQFVKRQNVPIKKAVLPLWLIEKDLTRSYFTELSYVVRADIYKKLIKPNPDTPQLENIDPILRFHFEFIRNGYLPVFLPSLAYFGRSHDNQSQYSALADEWMRLYNNERKAHLIKLVLGKREHIWRNGRGQVTGKESRMLIVIKYLLSYLFRYQFFFNIRSLVR